jgi:hypothetical protein
MDKYHPMLTKVEIQNIHPCLLNDEFPNQDILTPWSHNKDKFYPNLYA